MFLYLRNFPKFRNVKNRRFLYLRNFLKFRNVKNRRFLYLRNFPKFRNVHIPMLHTITYTISNLLKKIK